MKGLLVRVAADQSDGGGYWNGPADSGTGQFVYAAIPESSPTHPKLNKHFAGVSLPLATLAATLPPHLSGLDMHLDPDFKHLTYGDQIRTMIGPGDLLVFYAGMRDVRPPSELVNALIGLYVVKEIVSALTVPVARRDENAHTRRVLPAGATDIVVRARREVTGRLERYIPIGEYRERAYRVWPKLLNALGGLDVNNGYLQRSARLPEFVNAGQFFDWFQSKKAALLPRNN